MKKLSAVYVVFLNLVFAKVENLPSVLNGLGIAIISTSNGMMTDKEARKNHLGGEVIAYVW